MENGAIRTTAGLSSCPVEPIGPAETTDESYPYILITGRMLEHWHTGVMTRRSQVLDELEPEAFLCINGLDLTALGASIGDELRIASRRGAITAKARLDDGLPDGTIFMPFCYAEAAANMLTNSALDPNAEIRLNTNTRAVRIERADPGDGSAESRAAITASARRQSAQ